MERQAVAGRKERPFWKRWYGRALAAVLGVLLLAIATAPHNWPNIVAFWKDFKAFVSPDSSDKPKQSQPDASKDAPLVTPEWVSVVARLAATGGLAFLVWRVTRGAYRSKLATLTLERGAWSVERADFEQRFKTLDAERKAAQAERDALGRVSRLGREEDEKITERLKMLTGDVIALRKAIHGRDETIANLMEEVRKARSAYDKSLAAQIKANDEQEAATYRASALEAGNRKLTKQLEDAQLELRRLAAHAERNEALEANCNRLAAKCADFEMRKWKEDEEALLKAKRAWWAKTAEGYMDLARNWVAQASGQDIGADAIDLLDPREWHLKFRKDALEGVTHAGWAPIAARVDRAFQFNALNPVGFFRDMIREVPDVIHRVPDSELRDGDPRAKPEEKSN
jgi:hypothetical protein